jgi:hypothetical protein
MAGRLMIDQPAYSKTGQYKQKEHKYEEDFLFCHRSGGVHGRFIPLAAFLLTSLSPNKHALTRHSFGEHFSGKTCSLRPPNENDMGIRGTSDVTRAVNDSFIGIKGNEVVTQE